MSEGSVLSMVQIGPNAQAIQRSGAGWHLVEGFKTTMDGFVQGPFGTLAEVILLYITRMTYGWQTFDQAKLSGRFYSPIVALRAERIRVADRVRVDSFVKLEGGDGMAIGRHVHIASFCHLGIDGGVTILEEDSSYGSGVRIISGPASFVHVKKGATLQAGVVVLPGVTIGEGAVVAAGSVVTADVPARAGA